MSFLILGCGFTGSRVAARLVARGERVVVASRDTIERGEIIEARGMRVLHSLPIPYARKIQGAERLVYFSTTGVYGDQPHVNGHSVALGNHPRLDEERGVAAACANHLILRPAAIYGPGRGVHVSIQQGRHKYWGDGSNYISRIHVDDLAAITAAALVTDLTGAYPVADDEPAQAIDITRFCAELLGVPVPPPEPGMPGADTRRANRQVDGRAIRQALGVELAFPSFRSGIPAAIAASKLMAAPSLK